MSRNKKNCVICSTGKHYFNLMLTIQKSMFNLKGDTSKLLVSKKKSIRWIQIKSVSNAV